MANNQLQENEKRPWWAIGVRPVAVHNGEGWLTASQIIEMGGCTISQNKPLWKPELINRANPGTYDLVPQNGE